MIFVTVNIYIFNIFLYTLCSQQYLVSSLHHRSFLKHIFEKDSKQKHLSYNSSHTWAGSSSPAHQLDFLDLRKIMRVVQWKKKYIPITYLSSLVSV